MNDTIELPATTQQTSLVGELTRAEIDQQIATAHAFKRSRTDVATGILELATWSPGAAAECNYSMPRGGKSLTGPSIRLAEIIAAEYGNCRVGARVVHVDRFEKYLEAEGVFHDLQKNTATTARVRRRIVDSKGRLYNDDMIIVTGNAACSIAKRNAILAGVPKALWMPAYEAALQVIKGDAKTLSERRDGALRALGAFGVTPDMICGALDINGPLEITIDHMPTMVGWHNALRDQSETVESLFPQPGAKGPASVTAPKTTAGKLADLAGGGEKTSQQGGGAKAGATAPAEGDKGATDQQAAGQQQTGADQGDDDGAGAPATDEQAREAFERGVEARRRGMKQSACPADIRASQRLFDAWMEGWEAGPQAKG